MSATGTLIRKYQLFKIGVRLRSQDFSGTLVLSEDDGTTTLYFVDGEPTGATSSLVSLSLPAFLLRKRRLERPRLKELLDQATRESLSLEDLLVRTRVLTAKELNRVKRELSEFVFASAFHKDRVPYQLAPTDASDDAAGANGVQLPLHEALFRAVATDQGSESFSRMFKDRWDQPLTRSADFYRYLLQFRSTFYGEDITEALMAEGITAQEIVDGAEDKESALRQLFGLTYSGMLTFEQGEAQASHVPDAPTPAVESMEAVEENKTLVFMPEDIPTTAPQTVFLGTAMPFQSDEVKAPEPAPADEPDRPEDLDNFLRDGFGGEEDAKFEEALAGADEDTNDGDEEFELPVVLDDGRPALADDQAPPEDDAQSDDDAPVERQWPPPEEHTAPEAGPDDEGEADVEELLKKAVDEATLAVKEGKTPAPQPISDDLDAVPADVTEEAGGPVEKEPTPAPAPAPAPAPSDATLAFHTPPPPPPKPKESEQGTDESIERILEDVYRSMLSRNLYQVLGVTTTTPISAIRDAAARMTAKYSPEQYKGYMLSSRASTILDYVQQELNRAFKVLTNRVEREAYDGHVGTQYDRPTPEALTALFDAEDALLAGLAAQRKQEWGLALESFSKAADLNSRDPDYLAYQGWATYQAFKSGQTEDSFAPNKARNVLERALAIDPRNARALLFAARIEKDMNNMEAARIWYERLYKQDPNNDEVIAALEWLRMSAGIARQSQSGFWNWLKGIFIKK